MNHFWPNLFPAAIVLVAAIVFFLFIAMCLVWFVMHAPMVDSNVLCAGLCGFLMLGLLWVPSYMLVAQMVPGAFASNQMLKGQNTMAGFKAIYFSFVTLCTVGYGDITPVSKAARMLVIMQSIAGLFYMAVLLARLVALYSVSKSPGKQGDSAELSQKLGR